MFRNAVLTTDSVLRREVVVLVHGLGAHRLMMKPLARRLTRGGFQTRNWGYPSTRRVIQDHARNLTKVLEQLEGSPTVGRFHLVTHSMGGIVARQAMTNCELSKLGRLVMLGPPNGGSRVAAKLACFVGRLCPPLLQLSDSDDSFVNQLPAPEGVQLGVIAAQFDRVVRLEATHLPNETDHTVVPAGHGPMIFRRDVAELAANFLKFGRFEIAAASEAAGLSSRLEIERIGSR